MRLRVLLSKSRHRSVRSLVVKMYRIQFKKCNYYQSAVVDRTEVQPIVQALPATPKSGTELMREAAAAMAQETWTWMTEWSQLRVLLILFCIVILALIMFFFIKRSSRKGRPTTATIYKANVPQVSATGQRADSTMH